MPSTKDIDIINSPMKILLVGPNGTGKTVAAASFFKEGKIQIEDSDIRMKPVAEYFPDEDINYDSYTSDNFNKFVTKIHDIISGTFTPNFKTWVIDSVTGFSITAVTYQLKMKDKIKTTKGGLPSTSWDEINGETVLFHEMLEAAQILYTRHGCNIIFTAHPVPKTQIIAGEDAKQIISIAAYGNKVPAIVPGFFDEIYNLQVIKTGLKEWNRVANRVPMDGLPGKTVFRKYLPESIDFTEKNFYEVLKAEINKGVQRELNKGA